MQAKPFSGKKLLALTISLSILTFLLVIAINYNPVIEMDNPALEAVIRKKIKKPVGETIYRTDILSIINLDASNSNLQELDGIHYLRRLTSLNLENNHISDVSPLAELKMLTRLNLQNNNITCLEAAGFSNLTRIPLRRLEFNHSQELGLVNSKIEDITLIGNLTHLERLELRGQGITDISPLANLSKLKYLNLRDNNITDIGPLSGLRHLTYLNLHSNHSVTSIAPIARLYKLEALILSNIDIGSEIAYFENLTRLMRLNIRNCNIAGTEVLAKLMAKGALQDDWKNNKMAKINILHNQLPEKDFDAYSFIRPYWKNIFHAKTRVLPSAVSSVEAPQFSHKGGFQPQDFELILFHPDPNVTIYYTLDGSIPDTANLNGNTYHYQNHYKREDWQKSGKLLSHTFLTRLYSQPIKIYDRSSEPDKLTRISTTFHRNPESTVGYFPSTPVHKGIVVRAIAVKHGKTPSQISTNTYFVGENPYTLPIISLAIQENELFDYKYGIYVAGIDFENRVDRRITGHSSANYKRRSIEWEVSTNIEYHPVNINSATYNKIIGSRIHGGKSRFHPSKSLRLYSRDIYGSEYFSNVFFDSKKNAKYNSLILRNSGNDYNSTYFRDALIHKIVEDLKFETLAYQPTILFLNGEYWGIMNIRERYDICYLAEKYNLNSNQIDYLTLDSKVKNGKATHYISMLSKIQNSDLTQENNYEEIQTLMDISNFIDYNVTNIYISNTDWPDNNVDYWRYNNENLNGTIVNSAADGRWRWLLYDTDLGLGEHQYPNEYKLNVIHNHNTLANVLDTENHFNNLPSWSTLIIRRLLTNESFKTDFISRFTDLLNTTFLPERIVNIIEEMQAVLEPEMPAHIHRWRAPESMEKWQAQVNEMKEFARQRPGYQRQHIMDFFNLEKEILVTLNVNNDKHGYIKINTIDITPSKPGVSETPYPWTGIYFHNIPIQLKAIPLPGYKFLKWEGFDVDSNKSIASINLLNDITATAIFAKE